MNRMTVTAACGEPFAVTETATDYQRPLRAALMTTAMGLCNDAAAHAEGRAGGNRACGRSHGNGAASTCANRLGL